MPVAVVTDSTAMLPAAVAAGRGILVVPLQVVLGSEVLDEGSDGATPARVARALEAFRPVSTSRPSPTALAAAYDAAVRAGATEIVSVHLSGEMSGTVESAQVAARAATVPVVTVDTRQVGVATGYAALAAADVADAGGTATEAAAAAHRRAEATSSYFYVDTLEYLRRGGRIGAAAALLGGVLAVKPLLGIENGVVASLERVRTSSRALARLEELAVTAAHVRAEDHDPDHDPGQVDVCVAHLASPERAAQLAAHLTERLAAELDGREVWCGELGAVLGAHVGPGMLAVCVAPR